LNYLGRSETGESRWAEQFAPLLQAVEREEGRVGLLIYDLGTGQTYGYNHDEMFTPASNTKLFTGAAALDALGPDYQFQTLVAHDGTLDEDGRLTGNLILKGYGDPTLTTETLTGWANDLVEAGIRHVSGDILVDTSYFEDENGETGWGWSAGDPSLPPQTGALSVNHNQVELTAIPGKTEGSPSWIRVEPTLGRQVLYNNVATVAAGQNPFIDLREDEKGIVLVEGQLPAGGTPVAKQAMANDPALYAGVLFGRLLTDRGVIFPEESTVRRATMPDDTQSLIDHRSEPLSQVLAHMLKASDNFTSEQVLRTMGAQVLGSGSGRSGQQVITRFLEVNGLSTYPYVLSDGCGLRLDNELSPELVVGLLILMAHHPHGDVFHDALSVAGVDGTLAQRLRNTPAQEQVYAKTGSLLGASALSGYVTTPDERELAFAIMMTGQPEDGWSWVRAMRRIQDDMILASLD
jgi:D-alanyl-D-alanine carboxypeptidase/D-alanyl-D-alanine-endopeptidase (penicillin-binding protein 4)